jgi:hypothetical protein
MEQTTTGLDITAQDPRGTQVNVSPNGQVAYFKQGAGSVMGPTYHLYVDGTLVAESFNRREIAREFRRATFWYGR